MSPVLRPGFFFAGDAGKRPVVLVIIIPTFQAENALGRLLLQLEGERVIVADAGSTDKTVSVAVAAKSSLALGASGRGAQLRLGARFASLVGAPEDWFLFLHADSQLPPAWRAVVETAMQKDHPRYFRFKAEASGLKARLMDRLVALRCSVLGLPYGDQGLLISRTDYETVGGFASMPLFEDVDMIERLQKITKVRSLPASLVTDVSAHWRDGLWARGTRNLGLLWRYKRGATADELHRAYQR